jgi:hypothetical protein
MGRKTVDLSEQTLKSQEPQVPSNQLVFHDAVFGGQIFVSGQQLMIHRPCDVGQDARPIHNVPFAPIPAIAPNTGTPPAPLCWPRTTDGPISRFRFLTYELSAVFAAGKATKRASRAFTEFLVEAFR